MAMFSGKIETDPSFKQLLQTYRVTLRYLRKLEGEKFPAEVVAPVTESGIFQLNIDDDAKHDGAASVTVAGPTSETFFVGLLSELLSGNNKLKPIRIVGPAPKIALSTLPPGQLLPTRRLSLRVFIADKGALTGKAAARTYVQLLGQLKTEGEWTPIASGTTDAAGYLSLSIPVLPFKQLLARTGTVSAQTETEIALLEAGAPPDKIILTVSEAGAGGEDCNCDLVPPRLPDAEELAANGDVIHRRKRKLNYPLPQPPQKRKLRVMWTESCQWFRRSYLKGVGQHR